jgi:hypothetical protein
VKKVASMLKGGVVAFKSDAARKRSPAKLG